MGHFKDILGRLILINDRVYHDAVCRVAPDTPSLLKSVHAEVPVWTLTLFLVSSPLLTPRPCTILPIKLLSEFGPEISPVPVASHRDDAVSMEYWRSFINPSHAGNFMLHHFMHRQIIQIGLCG